MSWQTEIPIIVRNLINDMSNSPEYSDTRLTETCVVAAQYVILDISLEDKYTIDIVNQLISPDPCDISNRDSDFICLIALKTACIIDQSTFRTKSALEGIKTSLGSASLSVNGNLSGYKVILDQGPCKAYSDLVEHWDIKDAAYVQAILSPFVGNKFYPNNLPGPNDNRSRNYFT
jgi:hypothetical protein